MEQRLAHPLDIELLSFVLGDANAELVAEVQTHLGTCLLCRIHIARIRRSGVSGSSDTASSFNFPTVSPDVLSVLDPERRPVIVEPGQVWLAGSPHRIVLWVDDVDYDDQIAHVFAATFDVGAADHTSLVKRLSQVNQDIAVFTSVAGTVPLERLDHYVEDLPIHQDIATLIDAIDNGTTPAGLTVGTPVLGGTDERLEFRQMLADDLAALDPYIEDDDLPVRPPVVVHEEFDRIVAHMRGQLSSDLRPRRGNSCEISPVDEAAVGSFVRSLNLTPVANIQELTCRVLVVSSEAGPGWAADHAQDAYELLVHSRASTLAVAAPSASYSTQLFEPPLLHSAFELPNAFSRRPARPMWEARPMVSALFDYLDGDVFKISHHVQPQRSPVTPDLMLHLPGRAASAIDTLRKIRATQGKNRALKALSDLDAQELAAALAADGDLDEVLALIEEITNR